LLERPTGSDPHRHVQHRACRGPGDGTRWMAARSTHLCDPRPPLPRCPTRRFPRAPRRHPEIVPSRCGRGPGGRPARRRWSCGWPRGGRGELWQTRPWAGRKERRRHKVNPASGGREMTEGEAQFVVGARGDKPANNEVADAAPTKPV
jgi:hypothetical protein